MLGVRARSRGLTRASLDRALAEDRSIARTWLMRGTLPLVDASDLRPMLLRLGPVFAAAGSRRHAQLGLDDDVKRRGLRAIASILASAGPLTRHEIVDGLQRRGIKLDRRSQAPIHLIAFAAMQGICCFGPNRDNGESTFVLLDDWIPRDRAAPMPLGELAVRYFAAFGPATVEDLAWWSGLPMRDARSAVGATRSSLAETTVGRQSAFLASARLRSGSPQPDEPAVRLLPAFDTYLLGYRRRGLAVPPAVERRLQRGGGWLHPAVIVDGRAVAAWSLRKSGSGANVVVEGMRTRTANVRRALEAEARDIGQFLNQPVGLTLGGRAVKRPPR